MKNRNSLKTVVYVTGLTMVMLVGCDEPYEDQPSVQDMPAQETKSQPLGSNYGGSGNSTLGKAKGSAQNLVNTMEQNSQNLANEIDQKNKGNN